MAPKRRGKAASASRNSPDQESPPRLNLPSGAQAAPAEIRGGQRSRPASSRPRSRQASQPAVASTRETRGQARVRLQAEAAAAEAAAAAESQGSSNDDSAEQEPGTRESTEVANPNLPSVLEARHASADSDVEQRSPASEHKSGSSSDGPSLGPSPPRKKLRFEVSLPAPDNTRIRHLSKDSFIALEKGTPNPPMRTEAMSNRHDDYNKTRARNALNGFIVPSAMSLVAPVSASSAQNSIDTLLNLPVQRDFTPDVLDFTTRSGRPGNRVTLKGWKLVARDSSSTVVYVLYRVYTAEYTKAQAESICQHLVEVFNRWPFAIDLIMIRSGNNGPTRITMLLVRNFVNRGSFKASVTCQLPHFQPATAGNPNCITVRVNMLDPITGDFFYFQRKIRPVDVINVGHIPDVPAYYEFDDMTAYVTKVAKNPGEGPIFASQVPSQQDLGVSDDEHQNLLKAERLARYITATIATNGTVMNHASANVLWQALMEKCGGSTRRMSTDETAVFAGRQLFRVARMHNYANKIHIGSSVLKTLKDIHPDLETLKLPDLIIRSTNRSWGRPAEQAIIQTWLDTGSVAEAWIRGAEIVDELNQAIRDGEPPPNLCNCTPEVADLVCHPCAGCGRIQLCQSLVQSRYDGQRVCGPCENRRGKWIMKDLVHDAIDFAISKNTHSDLTKSQGETGRAKISREEREKLMKDLRENLFATLPDDSAVEAAGLKPGLTYYDQYTGKLRQQEIGSASGSGAVPTKLSLDAAFPAWPTPRGYRVHVAGNVFVTTQAINYAKHIQLPAFLYSLGDYVRQRDAIKQRYDGNIAAPACVKDLENLERQMVDTCDQLRTLRFVYAWEAKKRISQKVDSHEFFRNLRVMKAGRVPDNMRSGSGSGRKAGYTAHPAHHGRSWASNEIDRIKTLVLEMETFFHVQLPRSKDECPYFGHPDTMPEDWSWRQAFKLMAERLVRMVLFCNCFWTTEETTMTIFLECIFQVCIIRCVVFVHGDDDNLEVILKLKEEYSSILELPLTVAYHDALRFAVAKKVHGKQMRSGWPTNATSLDQRLEGNALNNISIEPCTENYAKSNFDPSTYEDIKNLVRDINLPSAVYGEGTDLDMKSLEIALSKIDWDADYPELDYGGDLQAEGGDGLEMLDDEEEDVEERGQARRSTEEGSTLEGEAAQESLGAAGNEPTAQAESEGGMAVDDQESGSEDEQTSRAANVRRPQPILPPDDDYTIVIPDEIPGDTDHSNNLNWKWMRREYLLHVEYAERYPSKHREDPLYLLAMVKVEEYMVALDRVSWRKYMDVAYRCIEPLSTEEHQMTTSMKAMLREYYSFLDAAGEFPASRTREEAYLETVAQMEIAVFDNDRIGFDAMLAIAWDHLDPLDIDN
ncbi:hypothetical protein K4K49_007611 [Colletotrichum sp. SAR 10_70]|nr:hypothetical protein K4K50_005373 [Colletotrichum sp. SAR 10_71]KAI8159354.1 hypothetical protein K4K49_007611 [Colletotrichum sp. SAR 10_70]